MHVKRISFAGNDPPDGVPALPVRHCNSCPLPFAVRCDQRLALPLPPSIGCAEAPHLLLERIRHLKTGLRVRLDVVERHRGRELDQGQPAAAAVDGEDAEIGDHHVDDGGAGERQVAAVQEL
jgi:hypothetical protein